jgi:hypothetical protein
LMKRVRFMKNTIVVLMKQSIIYFFKFQIDTLHVIYSLIWRYFHVMF